MPTLRLPLEKQLRLKFPKLFTVPVPLTLGAARGLKKALPGYDPEEIIEFLKAWKRQPAYIDAVIRCEQRRRLDGKIARRTMKQRERTAENYRREHKLPGSVQM